MNGCSPTITPRNGHTPVVAIVARTSSDAETESRLQEQIDRCKAAVTSLHGGELDYRVFTVVTDGNSSLAEIEQLIRSGSLDFLVAADASRLGRAVAATYLIGMAIDHRTRVLLYDDGIDSSLSDVTALVSKTKAAK